MYARTSTNRQEKGLEAQIRALQAYCLQRQISQFDIFSDEGISGAKSSRPGLDTLMTGVRNRKYSGLIVFSFSRFARSTRHLLDALDEFQNLHIQFVSVSENLDTGSAIGKALFTIISAISQLERELVSERVKNGLKNAMAKGKKLGRPKKRNSDLIIELFKQGHSYRKIAKFARCSTWSVSMEIKKHRSLENG